MKLPWKKLAAPFFLTLILGFANNDIIYDSTSNLAVQALEFGATGQSSVASVANGVFYVLGNFVQVNESTTILSKYDNTPSLREIGRAHV